MPRSHLPVLALLAALALVVFALTRVAVAPADASRPLGAARAASAPAEGGPQEELAAARALGGGAAGARAGARSLLAGGVVDRVTGGPVALAGVALESQGRALAAARSDAQGRVVLECVPCTGCDLRVEPPAGWWLVEAPQQPTEEHWSGRAALRIVLAPDDAAPLSVRVIDTRTREPVPRFVLRVRPERGAWETVRSGADGRAVTETFLRAGALELRPEPEAEGAWMGSQHFEHRPDAGRAAEATLSIAIGPTYRLDMERPPGIGLEHLGAFLVPDDRLELSPAFWNDPARIRPGEPREWVRFDAPIGPTEGATLFVRSHGGGWATSARVAVTSGIDPAPVAVRLERMGSVAGNVQSAEGQGVSGARVHLIPAGVASQAFDRAAISGARGRFLIRGVAPGDYLLSAVHERHGATQVPVLVTGGEAFDRPLELSPYRIGGDVTGVVQSASGTFDGRTVVRLTPIQTADEVVLERRAIVEWDDGGTGRFEFRAVPAGRYRLVPRVSWSPHLCAPAALEVAPPALGLRILVEDREIAPTLRFDPLDAATRRWIPGAHLRVVGGEGGLVFDGPLEEWDGNRRFAPAVELRWTLSAPGYVPARGDRSHFVSEDGWPWQVATVPLRRAD